MKRSYSNIQETIINEFWNQLYKDIEARTLYKDGIDRYNTEVFKLLNDHKKMRKSKSSFENSDNELKKLQMRIEDLTSKFDDKSIFKESPNLIRQLIGKDLISAKSYLFKYIPKELYEANIAQFGEYTLEAIIIYVLGMAFHSIQESLVVRVSTLLALLDRTVITQANIINKNLIDIKKESSKDNQKKVHNLK